MKWTDACKGCGLIFATSALSRGKCVECQAPAPVEPKLDTPAPKPAPAPSRYSKPAKAATKRRPCICCSKPFPSEGAHNRMCDFCRKRSDHLGDMQVVRP